MSAVGVSVNDDGGKTQASFSQQRVHPSQHADTGTARNDGGQLRGQKVGQSLRKESARGCRLHTASDKSGILEQVAWRHFYLLEAALLLQQRHLRPQLLQLAELSLSGVGYGCGQGSSRPVFPRSICFRRTKAASLRPPSIPCFPL